MGLTVYLRSDIHRHNRFLASLRSALAALPLPEATVRLAADARLGLLAGNGNHCDYVAAELHATQRSRAEVIAHYAPLTLQNTEAADRFAVEIVFSEGNAPTLDVSPPLELKGAEMLTDDYRLRYVVFVRLIGYHDAGCDPRCF